MLDHKVLHHIGGLEKNSLSHIVNSNDFTLNDFNEINTVKHSPYFDWENIAAFHPNNANLGDLVILSVNIRSLNAKFN